MVKYLPLKSLDLDERSEGSGSRSFAPHPEDTPLLVTFMQTHLHHAPDVAVGGRPVAVAGAGHHGVAPGAEVDVDVALVDALALVLVGVLGDHRGLAVVDALVLADELEALAPAHRPLPSVGGAGQVPVGRLRGVDRERPWRLGVAEHGGVELAALLLDLPAARVGDGVAAIGAAELLEPGRHGPAWLRAAAGAFRSAGAGGSGSAGGCCSASASVASVAGCAASEAGCAAAAARSPSGSAPACSASAGGRAVGASVSVVSAASGWSPSGSARGGSASAGCRTVGTSGVSASGGDAGAGACSASAGCRRVGVSGRGGTGAGTAGSGVVGWRSSAGCGGSTSVGVTRRAPRPAIRSSWGLSWP